MKFLFTIAAVLVASATAEEVTPVQKVIQLLNNMAEKGKEEKHAEQVQFAAYKEFCDNQAAETKDSIEKAGRTIERLNANIAENVAVSNELGQQIAGHNGDIAAWEGDKSAATKVRDMERKDYENLHTDYSESVSALQRAIQVLKEFAANGGFKRAQAPKEEGLLQVANLNSLDLIPAEAKKTLELFLVQEEGPEAAGYEFQSHGVIDMCEKLLDKFIQERTDLEKEEQNSVHAYEMLMQELTTQVNQANKDVDAKSKNKAAQLQAKADAEGDLSDTSATKKSDEEYLGKLVGTCESKASDFESRQELRAEELQAIAKATEILSGGAVSGAAEKHLPGDAAMLQKKTGSALASFRASTVTPAQQRAAQFLQDQAHHLQSRVLSALAVRVSEDPFAKVKKMIKDLITRLLEETNEEATHKGWCDTELGTNEQTRKDKTQAVESLHAEIDELEASIAKLTSEVAQHSKDIAEYDANMAKATKNRQEEKATNTQTIKDAQEAQEAIGKAVVVLKEFYARAGEATALAQVHQRPDAPEIFDSPYTGMQAENGGVVGMLEVISSDFARLEADTTSAEETSQKAYDDLMTNGKVMLAQWNTDVEHKTAKTKDEGSMLAAKKADKTGTQRELDAALAYYEKLKPSCIDAGVSFDERSTRRKEEIESLQEALRILNGEDLR